MFEYNTKDLFIKPLFSIAGLATQIVFLDKSEDPPFGLLLDVGDGTCRDILENKLDFNWFNLIAISHGHYDHMGGLYSFLGLKRMLGSSEDITIIYPEQTLEVKNVLKMFKDNYRDTIPFTIKEIIVSTKKQSELSLSPTLVIKSFPTLHRGSTLSPGILPLIPSCGYQVHSRKYNFTIAFSGDTAPTPILYDLFSDNVDIGFIETTHPDDSWVKDKINRFHLTEKEASEYSKNCKKAVFIHKLPPHIRAG